MKNVIKMSVVSLALIFSACAHETTEMDRELALKLVDKAGRIEIVQSGGSPLLGPVGGAAPNDRLTHNCRHQPIYSLEGLYIRTDVSCY